MRGFSMSNVRSFRDQTVRHLRSVGISLALLCGLSAPAWADLAPLPASGRAAEARNRLPSRTKTALYQRADP